MKHGSVYNCALVIIIGEYLLKFLYFSVRMQFIVPDLLPPNIL